jgi:hypothetical protein
MRFTTAASPSGLMGLQLQAFAFTPTLIVFASLNGYAAVHSTTWAGATADALVRVCMRRCARGVRRVGVGE